MTDDVEVYKFTSTGGDELCNSREGVYEGDPPSRPHPNCNCNITSVNGECYTIATNPYVFAFTRADFYITFNLPYDVACWNETGYSDERTKEINAGDDYPPGAQGLSDALDDFATWVDIEIADIEIEAEEFCNCNNPAAALV